MNHPPGLLYLYQASPLYIISSTIGYQATSTLIKYLGLEARVPLWSIVVIALLTHPIYIISSIFWSDYINWVAAKRRGAILAPQVRDLWPGGLSIISGMLKSFRSGYPGDIFLEWCEQYGYTYSLKVIQDYRVVTFEPEHIKAILSTQFDDFHKGSVARSHFFSLLGNGVFNSDGDMWKFHRSITRPFFTKDRISHFDIFNRHAEDAITQAKNRIAAGYPIDFQELASRFALDSAVNFLCGMDVHSLSTGLSYPSVGQFASSPNQTYSEKFVNAFATGLTLSALRIRYGTNWPLFEFWKDRVRPHREIIDQFIEPLLKEAIGKHQKGGEKEDSSDKVEEMSPEEDLGDQTLLDYLVRQTQDEQILKDELLNLLAAARDTTSSTLTFALYMMTQHRNVTKRLQEEISRVVGESRPTYEDIKEMKYLRAFINETLRLYPPVPFNSRASSKITTLPAITPGTQPFYIPAHTRCTYGVFLMHRRTDLWGPDALEFDPDRFIDARLHKYLIPNPFIFLPFNAGPRKCLGQQFAYNEVSFFLIRLLQSFSDFTLASNAQPADSCPPPEWSACVGTKGRDKIWPGLHTTIYVKGGLWVNMSSEEVTTGQDSTEHV